MKIYLASRYSRREELCGYRVQLEELGHTVTSRWLNGKHQISNEGAPIGDHGEKLVEDGSCEVAAALRQSFAVEDVMDVQAAEMVISFTEEPRSGHSRGGRHVEFGIGLERGADMVVIGHRENLFHWLPTVAFFKTWEEFLAITFPKVESLT